MSNAGKGRRRIKLRFNKRKSRARHARTRWMCVTPACLSRLHELVVGTNATIGIEDEKIESDGHDISVARGLHRPIELHRAVMRIDIFERCEDVLSGTDVAFIRPRDPPLECRVSARLQRWREMRAVLAPDLRDGSPSPRLIGLIPDGDVTRDEFFRKTHLPFSLHETASF